MMRMSPWPGVIGHYHDWLDLPSAVSPVTLLEGNTPLIPLPGPAERIGARALLVKFEGVNPTGSFKDRGMTVAVSEAVHRKVPAVICASTGNTAASAAAYAARAGLRCLVVIPQEKVAAGKLAGALAYGAEVVQIQGSFDDALSMVVAVSEEQSLALVNSLNPFRIEGQKTAAFEICDVLGRAPDWISLPVGNAGNITSYWKGFREYHHQKISSLPRILGVQAEGAAPLVHGHPIDVPETVATAIQIGRPARGEQALEAASDSGGRIIAVSDQQILDAQRELAGSGIWVEPASAASLAGVFDQAESGQIDFREKLVVCVCTGHGLKDPDIITKGFQPAASIPARLDALKDVLG